MGQAEAPGGAAGTPLPAIRHRTIIHLDLDAFFAQVEQRNHPDLRGRPVVVGGDADQRGVVHTATYDLRAKGVTIGMPLRQAKRLCPEAVFRKGRAADYQAARREVWDVLADMTPVVEMGLDEAYVDLTGARRLWPDSWEAACAMKARVLRETGLVVSGGVATNKLVAKRASGFAKPNGLLRVFPGYEADFLADQPIEKLQGVGHKTRKVFRALCITTIGQFAAIERRCVEAAFGMAGVELHERAWGRDTTPVLQRAVPQSISRVTAFAADTHDREYICGMLHYLVERAGLRLRGDALMAGAVGLTLHYADGEYLTRTRQLPRPTDADPALFAQVLRLLRQYHTRRTSLRRVGVALTHLRPLSEQLDIFAAADDAKVGRLIAAIDRVRARYGFNAVTVGATINLLGRLVRDPDGDGFLLHNPALTL